MVKTIVSQEILDILKTVGLNSYERKLFVTLLAKGTSTAGTLSELSGVPRSRTYDVLESLADKGFVVVQTNKPLRYVAIEPKTALDRIKKKYEDDYKVMAKRIDKVKKSKILNELQTLYTKGMKTVTPSELTGAIKGRHAMHQQLETIFGNAKTKISLLTSQQGLQELHENHSKILKEAAGRGVKIRIAAPISSDLEETVKNLKSFAEIRSTKNIGNLNGRFAIADGKELIFALTHDKEIHPTQDIHLWTQSDHVTKDVIEPLFNLVWSKAGKY